MKPSEELELYNKWLEIFKGNNGSYPEFDEKKW